MKELSSKLDKFCARPRTCQISRGRVPARNNQSPDEHVPTGEVVSALEVSSRVALPLGLDTLLDLEAMAPNISLFSINAILILPTDDSSRILAKYYSAPHQPTGPTAHSTSIPGANPYPNLKDQKAFEKGLLEKTAKQNSDVILYDNRVVVFKMESDVMLYVVGGADENEILLYNVILALRDSLNILLKYSLP